MCPQDQTLWIDLLGLSTRPLHKGELSADRTMRRLRTAATYYEKTKPNPTSNVLPKTTPGMSIQQRTHLFLLEQNCDYLGEFLLLMTSSPSSSFSFLFKNH